MAGPAASATVIATMSIVTPEKKTAPGAGPPGPHATRERLERPAGPEDRLPRGVHTARRLEQHGRRLARSGRHRRAGHAREDAGDQGLVEDVRDVRIDGNAVLAGAYVE